MLERLQHLKLIVDHALVATDIFLQNYLDRNLLSVGGIRFANDSVCTSTQCPSEFIESPIASETRSANVGLGSEDKEAVLLFIALWLPGQLVEHVCD